MILEFLKFDASLMSHYKKSSKHMETSVSLAVDFGPLLPCSLCCLLSLDEFQVTQFQRLPTTIDESIQGAIRTFPHKHTEKEVKGIFCFAYDF